MDKKPLGLGGELEKALVESSAYSIPPKIVLLLRDILDSPQVTQDIWNRKDYHRVISTYYDRILFVGEQRVFDVVESCDFPDTTAGKVGAVQAKRYGKPGLSFSNKALQALGRYHWPGNVRELGNVIEQAVLVANG